MAFSEDLTPFFADFAVPATLQAVDVANGVIFDRAYLEAVGNYAEGTGPVALAILADMPAVAQGQALVLNATTYTVRGVEPDGTGLVLLRLEAA